MKKSLVVVFILLISTFLMAGCLDAEVESTPYESGVTNENYVGDPDPTLDADYLQTPEEEELYDQFTDDVQNGVETDTTDDEGSKKFV